MTKKKQRLTKILVAVIALFILYFIAGSWIVSSVVKSVMLSTDSKLTKEINGQVQTTNPFAGNYDGNPKHALGYDYEDIEVDTTVGKMPGWLIPASSDKKTWAIYTHGIAGRKENGYPWLAVLHPNGYPTILANYRNDQGAPADPSHMFGYGLTEWQDLQAFVDYALNNGAEDIVLVGDSMGGAIIGEFLKNSIKADKVKALVLDSPALDVPSIVRQQLASKNLPFPGVISDLGLRVSDMRFPVKVGESHVKPQVEQFKGPVFIAHGDADTVVPHEISDEVTVNRTAPTTLLRVHGAEHVQSWKVDTNTYRTWLEAFLKAL